MKKTKYLLFIFLTCVLLVNITPSVLNGAITHVLTVLLLSDDFPAVEPNAVVLNTLLIRPWGLTFLPDNRILITEKGGGNGFPQWKGNVFIGALAGKALWRLQLNENTEITREQLFSELNERIRDVEQGPDGFGFICLLIVASLFKYGIE